MFQALQALFDAFDFGLEQVVEIVETLIHRFAEIVKSFVYRVAEVVNAMIEMRDTSALKIDPEQVSADDDSDGSPLVDYWVHLRQL